MNPAFKNIYMVSFLETVPQQLFKRQGIRKFFDPFRILMKRSGICCRKVGYRFLGRSGRMPILRKDKTLAAIGTIGAES